MSHAPWPEFVRLNESESASDMLELIEIAASNRAKSPNFALVQVHYRKILALTMLDLHNFGHGALRDYVLKGTGEGVGTIDDEQVASLNKVWDDIAKAKATVFDAGKFKDPVALEVAITDIDHGGGGGGGGGGPNSAKKKK